MKFNPEIEKLFGEHNIDYTEGVLVLLSIYHNLPLSPKLNEFFHQTIIQINVVRIVDRDYEKKKVIWNVPLFIGDTSTTAVSNLSSWDWVTNEYRPLFRNIAKDKGGTPASCLKRMKKFFSEHPDIRKNDVIEAAKMYIRSVDNPKYLQSADYFIYKDKGAAHTSRLEQYTEIIMEQRKSKEQPKMMK